MLRPLRDKIVVRPLDRKQSEVIIVVNSEKFNLGEVVACGPKADSVKPGDRVRFGTDEGYLSYTEWLDARGEKFLVMQEADVCFVEG